MRARRICWPSPDATCLHGGCLYCNLAPFRTLEEIRGWAEAQVLPLPHRAKGTQDALAAYIEGLESGFGNADTR